MKSESQLDNSRLLLTVGRGRKLSDRGVSFLGERGELKVVTMTKFKKKKVFL